MGFRAVNTYSHYLGGSGVSKLNSNHASKNREKYKVRYDEYWLTRCQMPRPPRYTTERSNPALRACRTGLGSAAARSFHAPSRRRKENGGTNAFLSSEVSNAWAIVSSFQFPLLQPCLLFGNDSDFFRKPKLDSRSLALAALSDERVVHFSYPLSMSSCARGRRPDALPSEPQSRRSSGVRRMAAPALPPSLFVPGFRGDFVCIPGSPEAAGG